MVVPRRARPPRGPGGKRRRPAPGREAAFRLVRGKFLLFGRAAAGVLPSPSDGGWPAPHPALCRRGPRPRRPDRLLLGAWVGAAAPPLFAGLLPSGASSGLSFAVGPGPGPGFCAASSPVAPLPPRPPKCMRQGEPGWPPSRARPPGCWLVPRAPPWPWLRRGKRVLPDPESSSPHSGEPGPSSPLASPIPGALRPGPLFAPFLRSSLGARLAKAHRPRPRDPGQLQG